MAFKDLFKPKWKHSNWKVRLAAVSVLTNKRILVKLAKAKNEVWEVKEAVIEKLTDQVLLSELAVNGCSKVREAAVNRLTDPLLLSDIAKNDESWGVRVAAYRKLGNEQAAKYEIACHEKKQYQIAKKAEALYPKTVPLIKKERQLVMWCNTCKKILGTDSYNTTSHLLASARETDQEFYADQHTCKICHSIVFETYKE